LKKRMVRQKKSRLTKVLIRCAASLRRLAALAEQRKETGDRRRQAEGGGGKCNSSRIHFIMEISGRTSTWSDEKKA